MKKVWVLVFIMIFSMVLLPGCKDKSDSGQEGQSTNESKDTSKGKDNSVDITISMTPTGEILPKDKVKHVTVHDPSIVRDKETGMYYIFGSHMAWAKSADMVNWSLMFNNINSDYRTLFANEAKWAAKADSNYDVSGNLWAPDVIYNEEMDKWCMYMSVNGPKWNSTICLLTADSPDGDWTYVGPVIQSGMSNGFGMTFDYKEATGESSVAKNRYTLRNGNPQWEPHGIDPCVVYDENGDLWMSYGSWSGGIGLFRLDNETGLRDYDTTYEYKSGVSDPYFGYKISGGNQRSGEASYIEKIGDYYYLFITYGGLEANGGYNMRVFRAEDITGPYVDMSGDDARYPLNAGDPGSAATGDVNGNVGIRLMTYYKWPFTRLAQVAQGHNSVWTESDGRSFLVYHRRTNDGTEGHEVRVHQMFLNEDGWLVTAPFEYRGELLSDTGYENEKLVGSYTILEQRQSINYSTLEYVDAKDITLNADGTVSGDYSGKWSVKENTPYVTITDGTTTYKGVFIEQAMEDTDYITMCFTILGDNELAVWGSKYLEGQDAVDVCVKQGTVSIPAKVEKDIELPKTTLYGTAVTYESSDTSIIANDGKVTFPKEETKVTITATFTNGEAVGTKEYNVRVIALADVDMEAFDSLFYENFNDGKKTEWTSPNASGALTIGSDNDERKQYLQFISGNDSGNRGAYRKLDEAVSGKFTLSFDAKLTAGTMSNRSQSAFVVLSSDSKDYDTNAAATGGYLLKLTNEPPADANGNNENKSNQTKWKLNDTEEVIDIPVDTWVSMTLEVDTNAKTVRLIITDCKSGTVYFDNNITPAGACDFAGFQMLRGRGVGTMSIDSIKAQR